MLAFEKKTEKFIEAHSLLTKDDYILVAVSGGPDSLALLDFLYKRKDKYGITVAAVHVDHMLRGEASKQDLTFVKEFCERRGLIFKSTSIDIAYKMSIDKTGMQETARKYRYKYFKEVMSVLHANKLMVGQHGDDQTETILMRLVRGSGGMSRAGIQIKRSFGDNGELIRPLLHVSKQEIEEYCTFFQLEPRRDLSNDKKDYTRNRFRIEILPFLKKENKRVLEHFQRFSEDLFEDENYLLQLAKKEYSEICHTDEDDGIIMNISLFSKVPLPLQRRVIHLILNYLYQQQVPDLTALHIDLIKQLIMGENPSGRLDLPNGLKAIRSYHSCRFTFVENRRPAAYCFELFEGDKALLPNGKVIKVAKGQGAYNNGEHTLIINPREVQLPIIVRTRQPGDKIKLKGIGGTKKIKDIFIDMKIPLEDRLDWPIVTDKNGKLLWIPGLKKSCYDIPPVQIQEYYQIQYSN